MYKEDTRNALDKLFKIDNKVLFMELWLNSSLWAEELESIKNKVKDFSSEILEIKESNTDHLVSRAIYNTEQGIGRILASIDSFSRLENSDFLKRNNFFNKKER
jgi:hypothetical protein